MMKVDPYFGARPILHSLFGVDDTQELLEKAGAGLHAANPYHNLDHELHVVYWAHTIVTNENSLMPKAGRSQPSLGDLKALAIASLFHDHNHSGGALSDKENIQRAIQRVFSRDIAQIMERQGVDAQKVRNLIRVTRYDGPEHGFAHVPKTLLERAIRDADLMMIYTESGRAISAGLAVEVGLSRGRNGEWSMRSQFFKNWCSGTKSFLEQAPMFTLFGQEVKSRQLEFSCIAFAEDFEVLVEDACTAIGVPAPKK